LNCIKKNIKYLLFALIVCIIFLRCDSDKYLDNQFQLIDLEHANIVNISINNYNVNVDSVGQITTGIMLFSDSTISIQFIDKLYLAGFWVGCEDYEDPSANLSWVGTYPGSNYTSNWGENKRGVFYYARHTVDPTIIKWPLEYGYPVDETGNPIIMGDYMTWSALTSDSLEIPILSHPIPHLVYTHHVWGYSNWIYSFYDLKQSIFIRFTIQNIGAADLHNIYIGFYTDTDLLPYGNSTGYDYQNAISYTYTPTDTGWTNVAGITFLEINGETNPSSLITSHRIMRKNAVLDPDFGEIGFETAEQVLYALKGLSNSGESMIDPITLEPTLYAFTGDPVFGTGWLDTLGDVRSLINGPVLSIGAGETASVTVLLHYAKGEGLAEAIEHLRNEINIIRAMPESWIVDDN